MGQSKRTCTQCSGAIGGYVASSTEVCSTVCHNVRNSEQSRIIKCRDCPTMMRYTRNRLVCIECAARKNRAATLAWHHQAADDPDKRAEVAARMKVASDRYYRENRTKRVEENREHQRNYLRRNPEYVRLRDSKRRARLLSAFVEDVTLDDVWGDGNCKSCALPVDRSLAFPDPMCATVDHILALSRGGMHSRENTQLMHFLCNTRKGARLN